MVKKVSTYIIIIALCLLILPVKGIENNNRIGFALKSSTNGFGADAVAALNKLSFRLGYEHLKYQSPTFDFSENGINYEASAEYKTGSILATVDYAIFNKFYLTVGASVNLFNPIVRGNANGPMQFGDLTIPAEMIGTFQFEIKPALPISPYVGMGFGKTISANKVVALNFELGAFYQGTPDINIEADGLLAPTAAPEHGQEELFEYQLSSFKFYPVLKLGLSFRLINF